MINNNQQYLINVAHLYGDLMNTYGDWGNIVALSYYASKIGVEVDTYLVSLNDKFDPDSYDFALFGGGQDYEQMVVSKDLPSKKADITTFIEDQKPLLAICGGHQLLGLYMDTADGKRIEGVGILNHYTLNLKDARSTVNKNKRLTGNIKIKNPDTGDQYIGFENHQGRTFLADNEKPLGEVIEGFGNNGIDKTEGLVYKNVYGSYFHGPVLTRNGNLAKRLLKIALDIKYPEVDWQSKLDSVKAETF